MNESAVICYKGKPILVVSSWMIARELIGAGQSDYTYSRLPFCYNTTDAIKVCQAAADPQAEMK